MRTLISTLLFAAAVAAVTVTTTPATSDDKKIDEKKAAGLLEGGYTLVGGEENGKAVPEGHIKGSTVRFTGDKIIGTDKDKKEFFVSEYKLDTSKTPWVITMTSKQPKEVTTTGLIKKDGDTITVIYALPGGEAPKEFKTKDKQNMFVMKNLNKEPNKFSKD